MGKLQKGGCCQGMGQRWTVNARGVGETETEIMHKHSQLDLTHAALGIGREETVRQFETI